MTKSPNQAKLKTLEKEIDRNLAGRTVSKQKVETIGKTLFELSKIFSSVNSQE